MKKVYILGSACVVQAARQAPSIIFLDELDGLVPARSSNSSGGDQVFASVVSTLLALMDGVMDRGAVVVIGATNRSHIITTSLQHAFFPLTSQKAPPCSLFFLLTSQNLLPCSMLSSP